MIQRTIIGLTAAIGLSLSTQSESNADWNVQTWGGYLIISLNDDGGTENAVLLEQSNNTVLIDGMGLQGWNIVWNERLKIPVNDYHTVVVYGSESTDGVLNNSQLRLFAAGYGGDDMFCGGDGDDILLGGDGSDELYGRGGDDQLHGDSGYDGVCGGDGIDELDLGGDAMERFQIGNAGKDLFIMYRRKGGVQLTGAQTSDYTGIPSISEPQDYDPMQDQREVRSLSN